jgi:hypothetical protein
MPSITTVSGGIMFAGHRMFIVTKLPAGIYAICSSPIRYVPGTIVAGGYVLGDSVGIKSSGYTYWVPAHRVIEIRTYTSRESTAPRLRIFA